MANVTGLEVDVIYLKNALDIRFVGHPFAQLLNGSSLIPKRFKESEWKLSRIKGLVSQNSDGLFNFDSVQLVSPVQITSCSPQLSSV
ncbi:hypothetical protein KKW20_15355 [Planktotalea lamellibrachiae]|nr:hypothetical protein [Aliiroseovarius lamellibrachiae]MBT2132496.1 hypothetical protein [Aliiroseovarius lamellibrachiae]